MGSYRTCLELLQLVELYLIMLIDRTWPTAVPLSQKRCLCSTSTASEEAFPKGVWHGSRSSPLRVCMKMVSWLVQKNTLHDTYTYPILKLRIVISKTYVLGELEEHINSKQNVKKKKRSQYHCELCIASANSNCKNNNENMILCKSKTVGNYTNLIHSFYIAHITKRDTPIESIDSSRLSLRCVNKFSRCHHQIIQASYEYSVGS